MGGRPLAPRRLMQPVHLTIIRPGFFCRAGLDFLCGGGRLAAAFAAAWFGLLLVGRCWLPFRACPASGFRTGGRCWLPFRACPASGFRTGAPLADIRRQTWIVQHDELQDPFKGDRLIVVAGGARSCAQASLSTGLIGDGIRGSSVPRHHASICAMGLDCSPLLRRAAALDLPRCTGLRQLHPRLPLLRLCREPGFCQTPSPSR